MLPHRGIGPLPTSFGVPLRQNRPPRGEHTYSSWTKAVLNQIAECNEADGKKCEIGIYSAGCERIFGGMPRGQAASEGTAFFEICKFFRKKSCTPGGVQRKSEMVCKRDLWETLSQMFRVSSISRCYGFGRWCPDLVSRCPAS